jgi:tRNA threonylcarbamoyladenosine modification (KEOPS) complex  Pcc1 subunit
MHSAQLKLKVKKPNLIKKSLEPDIKITENVKITLKATKKEIVINIKSSKLSYLKAVINSYISLVKTLEGVEEVI